ncbi:hypothetical protein R3P38DRAFT_3275803 [Favolaschia claudopus]|uniref:Uncharacterized protein n=1 Tax=Favolaschia claudopus TaxID=2862362 RepID=A0AAW0AWJ9_9AGAR
MWFLSLELAIRTDSRPGSFKFSHLPALSSSFLLVDTALRRFQSPLFTHSTPTRLRPALGVTTASTLSLSPSFPLSFTPTTPPADAPSHSPVSAAFTPTRLNPLARNPPAMQHSHLTTTTCTRRYRPHGQQKSHRLESIDPSPRRRRPHFAADADAYPIHIGACRPSFILPRFTNNTPPPPRPSRPLPDLSNDSPPRLSSPAPPPEPSATPHPQGIDFPDTHARCVEMAAPNLFRALHRRCHSKTLVSSRPAASLPSRTGIPHSQNSPPNFSAVGSILLVST